MTPRFDSRTSAFAPAAALALAVSALAGHAPAQCERQVLTGHDTDSNDDFGQELVLGDDFALFGARFASAPGVSLAGAVYCFAPQGDAWVEEAKLTASDASQGALFGAALDVDGQRALIGAWFESELGDNAGAAYVFERSGGSWTESQKLLPDPLDPGDFWDLFGAAVVIEGDLAFVGAPEDDDAGQGAGAVYVFELQAGSWVRTAKWLPPPGFAAGNFGAGLALEGDHLLVGAPLTDQVATNGGALFAYERQAGVWTFTQALFGSGLGTESRLGWEPELDGARAAARSQDPAVNGHGRVHVFELEPGGWVETDVLMRDAPPGFDSFGAGLDLEGDELLVGSSSYQHGGPGWGAVYRFERTPGGWQELAEWIAPGFLGFGGELARRGEVVMIGSGGTSGVEEARVWQLPDFAENGCFCASAGPCANDDLAAGCANSTGEGALLAACGSSSVAAGDLRFSARRLAPYQTGLLLAGAPIAGAPFNDGRLCTGGALERLSIRAADALGILEWGPTSGGWSAGEERSFQGWYRDPNGPCGTRSNVTSAVRITFSP